MIFSEYTVLRYLINRMDNIIFPENTKTPYENASFLKLQICILRNEDCSFRLISQNTVRRLNCAWYTLQSFTLKLRFHIRIWIRIRIRISTLVRSPHSAPVVVRILRWFKLAKLVQRYPQIIESYYRVYTR